MIPFQFIDKKIGRKTVLRKGNKIYRKGFIELFKNDCYETVDFSTTLLIIYIKGRNVITFFAISKEYKTI